MIDNDARERALLIRDIEGALRTDHNNRHSNGQEDGRFSTSNFQKELERFYPEVGSGEVLSTAVKIGKAVTKNPAIVRGMNEEKVIGLLKFIYNRHPNKKWPTVTKVVQGFKNGMYMKYVPEEIGPPDYTSSLSIHLANSLLNQLQSDHTFNQRIMKDREQEIRDLKQEKERLNILVKKLYDKLKKAEGKN